MFDPRDFASDPRTRPEASPRRDHAKEREDRERDGHRREYDPRGTKRQSFPGPHGSSDSGRGNVTATSPTATWRTLTSRDTPTRRGGPSIRWSGPVTSGSITPRDRKAAATKC